VIDTKGGNRTLAAPTIKVSDVQEADSAKLQISILNAICPAVKNELKSTAKARLVKGLQDRKWAIGIGVQENGPPLARVHRVLGVSATL
jgi:hypothetical protein